MGGEAVCLLITTPASLIIQATATPTGTTTGCPTTRCGPTARRAPVRCASASVARSAAARPRWWPRCAGCWPRSVSIVVVTNDIFTTEDAEALRRMAVLADERITPVETGACPHTAIRDDISANLDAVEQLEAANAPVELTLVESGGDNLTAIFSRALVDRQIFVIDVAGGDKVPRKGGPGVTTADLLVINKTDLAPFVNADLGVMDRDAKARRGELPIVFTSLVAPGGADVVASWVTEQLASWRSASSVRR